MRKLCLWTITICLTLSIWACPAFAADAPDLSDATFTVKAKVSGADTKITWKKTAGASYYRVWRSTTVTGKKTLRTKTTAYGKGFAKGVCDYLGMEFTD